MGLASACRVSAGDVSRREEEEEEEGGGPGEIPFSWKCSLATLLSCRGQRTPSRGILLFFFALAFEHPNITSSAFFFIFFNVIPRRPVARRPRSA